jgi:multiple antibiotic resistance protein
MTDMSSIQLIKFLVAMVVMMNPLGAISIFINLTPKLSLIEQKRTALIAGVAIATIMLVTTWVGKGLLMLLGITLPSFRFAGGVILLLMGLSMLQSHDSPITHTREEDDDAKQKDSIAIVPLALPLIIGPGAISTLIITTTDHPDLLSKLYISLISCLLAAGMAGLLFFANSMGKLVGKSVIKVVTRIMGMILTSIAAGMLASGLKGLFPILGVPLKPLLDALAVMH